MAVSDNNHTLAENKVLILYMLNKINKDVADSSLFKIISSINDINYFYASTGSFLEEDKDVYSYEMGYYVMKNKELVPFATRSGALDKAASLSSLVTEFSGWEIVEAANAEYFFKPEIIPNMGDLYFVINASTKKGESKADLHYEIPVENTKVTK